MNKFQCVVGTGSCVQVALTTIYHILPFTSFLHNLPKTRAMDGHLMYSAFRSRLDEAVIDQNKTVLEWLKMSLAVTMVKQIGSLMVDTHARTHTYIRTHALTPTYGHACTHTPTHVHTHHTYAHIYTHLHVHSRLQTNLHIKSCMCREYSRRLCD